MYEYSYDIPYMELPRCRICNKLADYTKNLMFFKRTHFHKSCFLDLFVKWETYSLSCILI